MKRAEIMMNLNTLLNVANISGEPEHQEEYHGAIVALTTGEGKRRSATAVLTEYLDRREAIAEWPENLEAIARMRELCA